MNLKGAIKNVAKKIKKDPMTKEVVNEEKKVAKKAIGKAAKRAQKNIKTKESKI